VLAIPVWIGLRLWKVARTYQRQFSGAHCVELAEVLTEIVTAACAQAAKPEVEVAEDDPRAKETSQSLALFYEVTQADDEVVHHMAIALVGRYTPEVIGATTMLFVARLLGQEPEDVHFGVSRKSVYHMTFILTPREYAEFLTREIVIPTEQEAAILYREFLHATEKLKVEPLEG
jgi:hypothetical protein